MGITKERYALLSIILVSTSLSSFAFAQQSYSSITGIEVSNSQILTTFGEKLEEIKVNRMIQIGSDISNLKDYENYVVYQVQIFDGNAQPASNPQWITALLAPAQSLSSALSWTPTEPGNYQAIISVGNNPNDLIQADKISIKVISDLANGDCVEGKEKIYKITDGSALCVTPSTADRLVERGYATRTLNLS